MPAVAKPAFSPNIIFVYCGLFSVLINIVAPVGPLLRTIPNPRVAVHCGRHVEITLQKSADLPTHQCHSPAFIAFFTDFGKAAVRRDAFSESSGLGFVSRKPWTAVEIM